MIRAGSRVKFISDTGVGTVRAIEGNLARVEVEDGFEIPALLSDLVEVAIEEENAAIVRIGPDDRKPVAPKPQTPPVGKQRSRAVVTGGVNDYGRVSILADFEDDEPICIRRPRREADLSVPEEIPSAPGKAPWEETDYLVELLFVPVSDEKPAEDSDLDLYLVNDSSYTLFFHIGQRDARKGYVHSIEGGTLEADSKIRVRSYKRTDLSVISTLYISLLPYKPTVFTPRTAEAFDLELHPLKFVRAGNYTENDYFDRPAVEYVLATSDEMDE